MSRARELVCPHPSSASADDWPAPRRDCSLGLGAAATGAVFRHAAPRPHRSRCRSWQTGAPWTCWISSRDTFSRLSVAHVDPEKVRWARELRERYHGGRRPAAAGRLETLVERTEVHAEGRGRNRGRTPAIALTAYTRREDAQRAFAAGFQLHVSKPVEPAQLVTMVATSRD